MEQHAQTDSDSVAGPTTNPDRAMTRRRFVRLAAGSALVTAIGLPSLLAACGASGTASSASPAGSPAASSATASQPVTSGAPPSGAAAASKPASSAQPQSGGTLKVVENAEGGASIGTPWEISGIDTKLPKPAIETLLRETPQGKYFPWLASKWDVDTAKSTITIGLNPGIKFHDGTDFNADAVVWNFQKAIDAKQITGWKSMDVVDPLTVRVNLTSYQNVILNTLSGLTQAGMISPTAFQKNGLEASRVNPVGTGPFKFQSFERGSKLSFTKSDSYWKKGLPYLDGVQYLFIRDAQTVAAAMASKGDQRVDVLASTSGEQSAALKAQGLNVLNMPVGPVSLIPDSKNADSPLSKLQVRQAISYAIDRDAIVKARGFGYWQPAYQLQNVDSPAYTGDTGIKYDPAKAKQLLADAGYPNGFKITIYIMPALVDVDAMTAVQRFLGAVGITVDLQTPDNGGYTKLRFDGGWKNGFLAQHTRALATFNITYNFYFPERNPLQFPPLVRPAGFLDKLNQSIATPLPDPQMGKDLTKMLNDDLTVIPIYYVNEMYILQTNVKDSGYNEWSASTIWTPETAWLSK